MTRDWKCTRCAKNAVYASTHRLACFTLCSPVVRSGPAGRIDASHDLDVTVLPPTTAALLDAPSAATLAVYRADGSILTSPAWYRVVGDSIEVDRGR